MDMNPSIDGTEWLSDGKTSAGLIRFEKVFFSYPTRPDISVLNEFSLVVQPFQTVALVGASGSGNEDLYACCIFACSYF
jgi:ABC-type multidrug transport system fused ATPase/permease subunit